MEKSVAEMKKSHLTDFVHHERKENPQPLKGMVEENGILWLLQASENKRLSPSVSGKKNAVTFGKEISVIHEDALKKGRSKTINDHINSITSRFLNPTTIRGIPLAHLTPNPEVHGFYIKSESDVAPYKFSLTDGIIEQQREATSIQGIATDDEVTTTSYRNQNKFKSVNNDIKDVINDEIIGNDKEKLSTFTYSTNIPANFVNVENLPNYEKLDTIIRLVNTTTSESDQSLRNNTEQSTTPLPSNYVATSTRRTNASTVNKYNRLVRPLWTAKRITGRKQTQGRTTISPIKKTITRQPDSDNFNHEPVTSVTNNSTYPTETTSIAISAFAHETNTIPMTSSSVNIDESTISPVTLNIYHPNSTNSTVTAIEENHTIEKKPMTLTNMIITTNSTIITDSVNLNASIYTTTMPINVVENVSTIAADPTITTAKLASINVESTASTTDYPVVTMPSIITNTIVDDNYTGIDTIPSNETVITSTVDYSVIKMPVTPNTRAIVTNYTYTNVTASTKVDAIFTSSTNDTITTIPVTTVSSAPTTTILSNIKNIAVNATAFAKRNNFTRTTATVINNSTITIDNKTMFTPSSIINSISPDLPNLTMSIDESSTMLFTTLNSFDFINGSKIPTVTAATKSTTSETLLSIISKSPTTTNKSKTISTAAENFSARDNEILVSPTNIQISATLPSIIIPITNTSLQNFTNSSTILATSQVKESTASEIKAVSMEVTSESTENHTNNPELDMTDYNFGDKISGQTVSHHRRVIDQTANKTEKPMTRQTIRQQSRHRATVSRGRPRTSSNISRSIEKNRKRKITQRLNRINSETINTTVTPDKSVVNVQNATKQVTYDRAKQIKKEMNNISNGMEEKVQKEEISMKEITKSVTSSNFNETFLPKDEKTIKPNISTTTSKISDHENTTTEVISANSDSSSLSFALTVSNASIVKFKPDKDEFLIIVAHKDLGSNRKNSQENVSSNFHADKEETIIEPPSDEENTTERMVLKSQEEKMMTEESKGFHTILHSTSEMPSIRVHKDSHRPSNEVNLLKNNELIYRNSEIGQFNRQRKPHTQSTIIVMPNSTPPSIITRRRDQSETMLSRTDVMDAFIKLYTNTPMIDQNDQRAEVSDQSIHAQEFAVTLADPPSISPDIARPSLTDNTLRRKISTTMAPKIDLTTTSNSGIIVRYNEDSRNRQRARTKGRPTFNATIRPRKPPSSVIDYDYYQDELPMISRSAFSSKLFITSKGVIHCLDQGNFPHPHSCRKFISCAKMVNGQVIATEYTCPDKLFFDPVGGMCNWSVDLGCKD